MSASVIGGPINLTSTSDAEGYLEFKATFRVKVDNHLEGPESVRYATGLPTAGSIYAIGNDFNPWAFCLSTDSITPELPDEKNYYWKVEKTWSNKPVSPTGGQSGRCNDTRIENPLLEPPKVSGGSAKYSEEATHDRYGNAIVSSSMEMLRGQQNEWDHNRSSIRIEMNVGTFFQVVIALSMRDCVNILPLWGYAARCIKLSNVTWERKYYGSCFAYYTVVMEFDTDVRTFDRDLLDEGTRVLKGHWDNSDGAWVIDQVGTGANARYPWRYNIGDFVQLQDTQGNGMRAPLNGYGLPAGVLVRVPVYLTDQQLVDLGQQSTARWICVAVESLNRPLNDSTKWRRISNLEDWISDDEPPVYDSQFGYIAGSVVSHTFEGQIKFFVALTDAVDDPPSANWQMIDLSISLLGLYSTLTTYTYGNVVSQVSTGTGPQQFYTTPGFRHVEKFAGVNFLLLGIPLIF